MRYASDPEYRKKVAERSRQWKKCHPDVVRKSNRDSKLKCRYGITSSDYDQMVKDQKGLCFLCKKKPKRTLQVDHSHRSGKVRKLLCWFCNFNLGYWESDVARTKRLLKYLNK